MTSTAGCHKAFFYGTLMSPEVLYRVIYGTVNPDPWQKARLSIQPGLLYGYQRHRVKQADYPAIYPLESAQNNPSHASQRVLGTVVTGLSDPDIMRLDVFEGDQYDRKDVFAYPLASNEDTETHSPSPERALQVQTYVWNERYLSELDPAEWNFEEFRREKLKFWAGADVEREDYDAVDEAVANSGQDGTGGRGANGAITKQLAELRNGDEQSELLRSAV